MKEQINPRVKLLNITEASKMIDGLSPYRIRQLCISGELPCFKSGKKYLIPEKSLLKVILGEDGEKI
ncbi:MAG: helix-turn-helix domain-containing protein [Eubacteriales bacterium]